MRGRNYEYRDEITIPGFGHSRQKDTNIQQGNATIRESSYRYFGKMSIFADYFSKAMLNKQIPDYYTTRDNISLHLIFLFVYSLAFVNVFTPFQGAWYNILHYSRAQLFTDTLIIVTGGILLLTLSRTLMHYAHKSRPLNYLQYFSWLILEVLLIAFLYAVIVHYVVGDTRDFSEIFTRAVVFVPTILVIPTIITHLYISSRHKDEKIEELESQQNQTVAVPPQPSQNTVDFANDFTSDDFVLDTHLTASEEAQTTESQDVESKTAGPTAEPAIPTSKIINFFDEKDELQLSLRLDHIYFLESAENYVNIYYMNKDNTERFTLRSTLKKQQEKLEKYGFLRCHRSYLVNFDNILLLRKDKDGPYLDFGVTNMPQIPVSKTYLDAVTAYFISNSEE